MVLYSLHVFDRSGRCLFDREWNGPRRDDGSGEHPRLVFGMLHSLGEVSNKLAPRGRAPDGHARAQRAKRSRVARRHARPAARRRGGRGAVARAKK